jgi:bifunctional NMN adenylyltransferase/nudix hydrolase
MNKAFDTSVIIGRFNPLHSGHVKLIEKALSMADNVVIFIGYSGFTDFRHFIEPETIREMIETHFKNDVDKLHIVSLQDMSDDRRWVCKLNNHIDILEATKKIKTDKVCFMGCKKDVQWYCNLLPNWDIVLIPYDGINATSIRKEYFMDNLIDCNLPEVTRKFLMDYIETHKLTFLQLQKSYNNYYSI